MLWIDRYFYKILKNVSIYRLIQILSRMAKRSITKHLRNYEDCIIWETEFNRTDTFFTQMSFAVPNENLTKYHQFRFCEFYFDGNFQSFVYSCEKFRRIFLSNVYKSMEMNICIKYSDSASMIL